MHSGWYFCLTITQFKMVKYMFRAENHWSYDPEMTSRVIKMLGINKFPFTHHCPINQWESKTKLWW